MPDLQANTSYSSGGQTRDPAAAYKAARLAIQARYADKQKMANTQPAGWQPSVPTKPYWGEGSQPIAGIPYAQTQVDPAHPQYIAPQTYTKAGQSVQSYVSPDIKTVPGEPGKFQSPTSLENLRQRLVPETSGGGVYTTDIGQPGEVIRSQRAVTPGQYEGSKMEYPSSSVGGLHKEILGGLPAAKGTSGGGFQIDHIVPLWLGGADVPENKQLLDPYTHEKKTKIQSVALTLLQANKINPDQAKMMALRWKDKDDSEITTFKDGFVDLSNAEAVAKRWQEQEAQVKPTRWGDVWKELKNLKNFGQEAFGTSAPAAFLREAVKSGASTATFGYIPYEMDDDYKDGYAKAAGMAGNIAGSVLGFIPAIKAIGLGFGMMNKGLKGIGLFNRVSTLGTGSKAIEKIGLLKDPAQKTKLFNELTKEAQRAKKIDLAWKNAGVFATYGQLSREGLLGGVLTGEDTDWKQRFLYDVAIGGSMGGWSNASQAAKEALKVSAVAGTLDAMINADDPNWTIQSSFGNGLTMGGLHYLFLKSGKGAGGPDDARMAVAETFGKKIKSGFFAAAKYNPQLKKKIQATGIDAATMEQEIERASAEMLSRVATTKREGQDVNDIDLTQATNDYVRSLIYARNEYIASLPKAQQHQARQEDMSTMMRYLYRNEPAEDRVSFALNDSKARLDATVPKSPANLATDKTAAAKLAQNGIIRVPLSGTEASAKVKANIAAAEQLNKEGRLGGEGILVKDPGQGALINASLGGKYEKPENHVTALVPYYTDKAKTTIAGWLQVGNLPEKSFAAQYNKTKKFTEFDVEKANKDSIGEEMTTGGEAVRRFDLEWESAKTTEGRSAVVIQIRPDAAERSRAINEAWNKRTQERSINDSVANTDIEIMRKEHMPVEWMNGVVAEFKNALETGDPERFVSIINKMWGKDTVTADVAKTILGKPTFTIEEMFKIIKGSSKYKEISFIVGDKMIPSKRASTAFKEYQNTNIKTVQVPVEVKTEAPKKKTTPTVAKKKKTEIEQKPQIVKEEFPEQAVTLGGEDLGGEEPVKRVSGAIKTKMKETPKSSKLVRPEALQKALRGAQQAVQESPLAKRAQAEDDFFANMPMRKGPENPRTIVPKVELPKTSTYTTKDQAKADRATKFIGRGSEKSSTNAYAKAFGEKANSGVYTPEDVVFISAEGNRGGRVTPDVVEIKKATDAGSTIVIDTKSNRERGYNVGEREVEKELKKNGYIEIAPGEFKPRAEEQLPLFAEGAKTAVKEAAPISEQPASGKRFTEKGEEIISLPTAGKTTGTKPFSGKFSNVEKELDLADLKRLSREDSPFGGTKKESLFDKAFNPKLKRDEGEYLESPSEASAIKIMRAVGEKNIIVEPNNGAIYINPESKLTGQQIMEKAGLSNLEFFDGIDHMASTIRDVKSLGQTPGRVLGDMVFRGGQRKEGDSLLESNIGIEQTPKGKRVMVGGKVSYPGSGMTDWFVKKAKSAEEAPGKEKPTNYEGGLATAFLRAISKITGKKATADNLERQFGVDGFFSKLSSKARAKTDTGGSIDAGAKGSTGVITQPRGLQKSRVQQERMRIGELPKEARGRLFSKRLQEEATSREQKEVAEGITSELPTDDININEGPQIGRATDVEQTGTFGLSMEDRAQSMKEEIPISELEYSLPGMALRTSGEKVNVTDGLKDGLMLAKQFADHYRGISKQKPKFVDFMELEKEIRASYDPDFKRLLPLMKKTELRRITKAIMQKTSPEGVVKKVDNNEAFVQPPSPRVDVKDMIKKYDGADPKGSQKIVEMFLKKQGYSKKFTGKSYENVWENKKYLNLLKANKEVKLATEAKK